MRETVDGRPDLPASLEPRRLARAPGLSEKSMHQEQDQEHHA
jgi:hypothetical protein